MEMTLQQIADLVGGTLDSAAPQTAVTGVSSLDEATAEQVSFLANARYTNKVATSDAAAVLVQRDYTGKGALIRCDDPYRAYRDIMVEFFGFREHPFTGVSDSATVDPTATLAPDVAVGPYATICAGATLGAGCVIYPGVFVGPETTLGAGCVIYPNTTLYDGTIAGDRVTVHAGCSIGHDGFGYATHANDAGEVFHNKIPQAGWVVLEDDVEIGACCTIDRATMGPTTIGRGTKFSNLIAIGHGTKLGKHCLLVAQTGLAGSVHVGDYCVFGGQAGIVGHISIGDGVRVAAQSGVTNTLPPGAEVLGTPAMPRSEARRVMVSMTRVPEMRGEIKRLTKQLAKLTQRLEALEAETE
ncbi:MAG: UDP-3-O-(3-hydroxymyristoyl)glucosamine N-acyltransferase [Phycisphaerales bacterium]|jgi:UDP-3-O-[3-hydroxymyristoyl] glucosamine N-acyltransferase|nr:UDP-3-O-(3-hydroxymyristoyl)glucosamine N-acyltransferase [Phycisphaerales bacterium]MBT7171691.1 UDP-3-O-(3-hydroxymyristoyl)glucosamine N-acyltransferase [Phycisphaerales bacterium]